jgi:hypothetical protein
MAPTAQITARDRDSAYVVTRNLDHGQVVLRRIDLRGGDAVYEADLWVVDTGEVPGSSRNSNHAEPAVFTMPDGSLFVIYQADDGSYFRSIPHPHHTPSSPPWSEPKQLASFDFFVDPSGVYSPRDHTLYIVGESRPKVRRLVQGMDRGLLTVTDEFIKEDVLVKAGNFEPAWANGRSGGIFAKGDLRYNPVDKQIYVAWVPRNTFTHDATEGETYNWRTWRGLYVATARLDDGSWCPVDSWSSRRTQLDWNDRSFEVYPGDLGGYCAERAFDFSPQGELEFVAKVPDTDESPVNNRAADRPQYDLLHHSASERVLTHLRADSPDVNPIFRVTPDGTRWCIIDANNQLEWCAQSPGKQWTQWRTLIPRGQARQLVRPRRYWHPVFEPYDLHLMWTEVQADHSARAVYTRARLEP